MKYFIVLALVIASCQSGKESPLSGTWEFEKNEMFPGVVLNAYQDSLFFKVLQEQQKNLTLTFKGNNFKVHQLKDGKEEPMGSQPFELSPDQKSLILKNQGRPDDIFPIVALSDSVLKLNMFHSKEGYLVFRKKK
jgi:hypothetical protein